MEVIEKSAEGLSRAFTVKVPASELDARLTERLEEMKGQVHLKGFRPGKAPVSFLKKRFGKDMMGEIIQSVVTETNQKVLDERELRPARQPHFHPEGDIEKVQKGEADLEYELHVEVLPQFEPMDVKGLEIERKVADVPDEDVDEALQNLAEQQREYAPREEGAGAEDGDQVDIDFLGKIDGEPFEGGAGDGVKLKLGSNQFIPGFEEQLLGVKTDDEKTIEVTFPEDYPSEELKGKAATFDVTVNAVEAPQEVSIDEDFAKRMDFDSLEDLKKAVRERFERDFAAQSRMHAKRSILDKLDEAHDFELPQGMVDQEFEQIWRQVESSELDEEDKAKSEEDLKADYRKIAERRVRLGLVLAEIGKRADVRVPQDELSNALQQQAMREAQMMRMQGHDVSPQQVLEFYRDTPGAIEQIRAPLYEEKVVDYILELGEVTETKVSKDELFADPDEDEASAA